MKVLVVKLSSLGDVVHAMPAVQDMRRAVPGLQVDWVVERAFADLVARCGGVDRVIPCDLRRWRRAPLAADTRQAWGYFRHELQQQAYDRVIDLQGLTKSALVAWMARLAPGGERIALGNRTEGSSYEAPTRWVSHRAVFIPRRIHAVDRSRVLCAHALDYTPDGPEHFGLRAAPAARDREVALVHGSSRADKLWPEPMWLELGGELIARGFRLGLPHGSDEEQARAQRLARALGPAAKVWPRLDLGALTDRLSASAGVVGVDSGLSHIATALDLPHVQIYNHDTAWRTGPVGRTRQRSVFASPHPAVAEVLAAWEAVITA